MDAAALSEEYWTLALAFLDPALEEERRRVFGHIMSADCPPCETQWGGTQTFRQAQDLADIAGFYRAFGLEAAAGGERLDHIATELEFASFLAWKEASAAAAAEEERAAIARDARRRFIEEHLGRWAPSFAARLAKIAGRGPYVDVARRIRAAISADADALGVALPAGEVAPAEPEIPAEGACFECGVPGRPEAAP